jgi:protein-S-isoprenylcysteine O-methyltransferase Ste14
MKALELRIPPPLVMVLSGVLAFFTSGRPVSFIYDEISHADFSNLFWPALFVCLGISSMVSGVNEFSRHKTTISPLTPHKTSLVVNSGIFRFTRNPMYLGMLLLLLGWADYLDNAMAFSGGLFFILYITRFQIQPEERVLLSNFSDDYQHYLNSVRRWL